MSDEVRNELPLELQELATLLGLDRVAAGRCSELLLSQLHKQMVGRVLTPSHVSKEIIALELGTASSTKPPGLLKHPPLGGLWHKHHVVNSTQSLIWNLFLNAKRESRRPDPLVLPVDPEDQFACLIHDTGLGGYMRRSAASEMTGEWLIFAKHEDRNYYLALAEHGEEGHPALRSQIEATCVAEFPVLREILDCSDPL